MNTEGSIIIPHVREVAGSLPARCKELKRQLESNNYYAFPDVAQYNAVVGEVEDLFRLLAQRLACAILIGEPVKAGDEINITQANGLERLKNFLACNASILDGHIKSEQSMIRFLPVQHTMADSTEELVRHMSELFKEELQSQCGINLPDLLQDIQYLEQKRSSLPSGEMHGRARKVFQVNIRDALFDHATRAVGNIMQAIVVGSHAAATGNPIAAGGATWHTGNVLKQCNALASALEVPKDDLTAQIDNLARLLYKSMCGKDHVLQTPNGSGFSLM